MTDSKPSPSSGSATPGPWELRHEVVAVGPGYNSHRAHVVSVAGRVVSGTIHHADEVTVYHGEPQRSEAERKASPFPTFVTGEPFPYNADAHLIAAAPELLAAVKAALAWPDEDEFGNAFDERYTTPAYRAYRQSLRDAIAKAEGHV